MILWQSVKELALHVGGKTTARKLLKEKGIVVVDGMYDSRRLDAAMNEPAWLRTKRNNWSLSHTSGLGAVKYVLDPLKINTVEHECRGSQWLMLEGPKKNRQFVKMYYTGRMLSLGIQKFELRNFLREDASEYYLCAGFDGPHLWAISARTLARQWHEANELGSQQYLSQLGFYVPPGAENHPGGHIQMRVRADQNDDFFLNNTEKIGL